MAEELTLSIHRGTAQSGAMVDYTVAREPGMVVLDAVLDVQALHAFRIQGKQVRYAMEIFAGAFPPEFREQLYPIVETLQDRLGAINDHVTAQTHFSQNHSRSIR